MGVNHALGGKRLQIGTHVYHPSTKYFWYGSHCEFTYVGRGGTLKRPFPYMYVYYGNNFQWRLQHVRLWINCDNVNHSTYFEQIIELIFTCSEDGFYSKIWCWMRWCQPIFYSRCPKCQFLATQVPNGHCPILIRLYNYNNISSLMSL